MAVVFLPTCTWKVDQGSFLNYSNRESNLTSQTTVLSFTGQTSWNNIVTRELLIFTVVLSQGEHLAFDYVPRYTN